IEHRHVHADLVRAGAEDRRLDGLRLLPRRLLRGLLGRRLLRGLLLRGGRRLGGRRLRGLLCRHDGGSPDEAQKRNKPAAHGSRLNDHDSNVAITGPWSLVPNSRWMTQLCTRTKTGWLAST